MALKYVKNLKKLPIISLSLIGLSLAFVIGILFGNLSLSSGNALSKTFPPLQIVSSGRFHFVSYDVRTKNPSVIVEILKNNFSENASICSPITKTNAMDLSFEKVSLSIACVKLKNPSLTSSFMHSSLLPLWNKLSDAIKVLSNNPDVESILVVTEPLYLPQKGTSQVSYNLLNENAVPTHFLRAVFYTSSNQRLEWKEFMEKTPIDAFSFPPAEAFESKSKLKGEVFVIPNRSLQEDGSLDSFRIKSWDDVKKIPGVILPENQSFYRRVLR